MTHLSIDFETASEADLKKLGAHAYSLDPSTRVLCMAWAFGNEPVVVWRPGMVFPKRVLDHVAAGGTVRGWNLAFEFAIWNNVLRLPPLDPRQLDDTMARAAYWGLPLSLDMAGQALGLGVLKDKAGHALMLRMCRPRAPGRWWHEEDPAKYDALCAYCCRDVEAETAIARSVPPLPERERAIWELDFRINQRGVGVDTGLVRHLVGVTAAAQKDLNRTIASITGGAVTSTNQTAALLRHLHGLGADIPDLQKETIKQALAEPGLPPVVRNILMVRRDAAKASTAKLNSLTNTEVGRRVRGMLQYYGASRTGRWAGRLLQPQNIPRGSIKDVDGAIGMILNGAGPDDLEMLFPVSALSVVSSCLRGCLVAAPGKLLVVADFAQIEARVVAWLAGQIDILDVFVSGQDIYVYTAHKIGSTDRQLGKVLVLACGFGMGPSKFQATAKTYGVVLDAAQAEDAVGAWRSANPMIVQFWWDCDDAARRIAAGEKGPIRVGPVVFYRRGRSMIIRLPSGRELVYRHIGLERDGDTGRDGITFDGVHQITKQWSRIRTYGGKLVENITQAVARDVMGDTLLELDSHDMSLVLTVHDEVLSEEDAADAPARLDLMLKTMKTPPQWAPGLPVGAAGWVGPRYKKG